MRNANRRLGSTAFACLGALLSACGDPSRSAPIATVAQPLVTPSSVFINEFHYDNDGTDSDEAVEIAGPAGTDLTGWSLVLHNGSNGAAYSTMALTGVIADQQNGYGAIAFPTPGLQNGSPDGIALVSGSGVVEFLSYEGTFVAADGPAAGLSSTDVGVTEEASTPVGFSLSRVGTGTQNTDFGWAAPGASSFGTPNASQTFDAPPASGGTPVFVNEIHYDNDGADADEAIEVAGPAGTNLSGWALVLYNGNGGAPYDTIALSGVIPNLGAGFGVLAFARAGIQNGSPDGVALVDVASNLVQFLSYEGAFTGLGGPADGVVSTDIGVTEASDTPVGFSLQLTGTGTSFEDFDFAAPAQSTFGGVNGAQTFTGSGDTPPLVTSTTPESGDVVGADATVTIDFSEPVAAGAGAFTLACEGSPVVFAVNGGPETFDLVPSSPLAEGSECSVTVVASEIADVDTDDPPDALPADVTVTFQVAATVTIAEIQGSSHVSPFDGKAVTAVEGIVTAVAGNGFYFQDPDPDRNIATSEGLFVFTGSAPTVTPGDRVSVSGPVVEFRGGCFPSCSESSSAFANLTITEITTPNTVAVLAHGEPLPAATVIGEGGRKPPKRIIDDDTTGNVEVATETVFDPKKDGIDFYESLEGMRVQVNEALAVSPTNAFGEIAVVGDLGQNATLLTNRGGILVRQNDFNPERIILDDELVAAEPSVKVGDRFVAPIDGVLSYSFGNFKLLNTVPLVADSGGLALETLTFDAREPDELDIATFNVENLSPADPPSKFDELAAIVVDNLGSPDILSLEEVQDNTGPTNNGVVDAAQTLTLLVDAIVAARGPAYEFRQIDPEDGQDGGQPGGNIRVAFLYRTDRGVAFVDRPGATATTANQVVVLGGKPALAYSPGRLDPQNPAFANSRKPLAGEFAFNDKTFFVVANHWNSKGGDQPLFGRFQPPSPASETQRLQQAQVVATFVENLRAVDKKAKIIVLGDLNDFEFSAPLSVVEAAGLRTLVRTLPRQERYTYVFDGNSQVLDHILLSQGARRGGFEYDIVHVNAEFPDPVSDHDPSVVRLLLPAAAP